MVSVCLPSDALLQHLPSYLVFSYLGHGVSLHGCSSKAQLPLLTLDEGYLLIAAPSDLQCGKAPLGPPAPCAAMALGRGVGPPGHRSGPRAWGRGVAPRGRHPWPRTQGSSSPPFLRRRSQALSAAAPDLGCGITPLGRRPCALPYVNSFKPKHLPFRTRSVVNSNLQMRKRNRD